MWRNISLRNAYETSRAMEANSVYGWHNDNRVDTHMIKNTEWGAVAYLSKSIYGKEDEIWINPSDNYTTGCAGATPNANSTVGCIYEYSTNNGVKASTTGNIYGIYDMSGGAYESVMGNYNNIGSFSGWSNAEVADLPDKYIDRYYTEAGNMLNGTGMNYDFTIKGDAIHETSYEAARWNGSTWIGNSDSSWYSSHSNLPRSDAPWFERSGGYGSGSLSDIYAYVISYGSDIFDHTSFRPVVIVDSEI